MKFLVFWTLHEAIVKSNTDLAKVIFDLQDYAKKLRGSGNLDRYYHVIGKHGGVWIFDVKSNEELDSMIARMPIYNYASYDVYPLTEMGGQ